MFLVVAGKVGATNMAIRLTCSLTSMLLLLRLVMMVEICVQSVFPAFHKLLSFIHGFVGVCNGSLAGLTLYILPAISVLLGVRYIRPFEMQACLL